MASVKLLDAVSADINGAWFDVTKDGTVIAWCPDDVLTGGDVYIQVRAASTDVTMTTVGRLRPRAHAYVDIRDRAVVRVQIREGMQIRAILRLRGETTGAVTIYAAGCGLKAAALTSSYDTSFKRDNYV